MELDSLYFNRIAIKSGAIAGGIYYDKDRQAARLKDIGPLAKGLFGVVSENGLQSTLRMSGCRNPTVKRWHGHTKVFSDIAWGYAVDEQFLCRCDFTIGHLAFATAFST